MMKIRPLHDRIVVRRLEDAKTTPGGIVVPDSVAEKPSRGEVLAVGPGKVLDNGDVRACDLKPGDKVIFGQYSGSTIRIDNEDLLMLSESEVLGVLEG
jgi:chaperonin GroES